MFLGGGWDFFEFSLHELEVDVEGVEGVADFVCDTGGEQGEGVEAFGFEVLFGFLVGGGEVSNEHDVAEGLFVVFGIVDG